jgi:thioesterase domain-containing protein
LALHAPYFEIFKRNIRAAQTYRPRKYSGRTVLILPEMRQPGTWPALLPEACQVGVPGNHFSMLRASNAHGIASLIEAAN